MKKLYIILSCTALLLIPYHKISAQMAVSDAINQFLSRFADANRIAEFEQTYNNAVQTLSSINETAKEMGITNENWQAIKGASEFIRNAGEWEQAANEINWYLRDYANCIKGIKNLVASGYMDPNYAMSYIRMLSGKTTDAVKTYNYFKKFYDTTHSSLTANEKLEKMRSYRDSLRMTRLGMNKLFSSICNDITEQVGYDMFRQSIAGALGTSKVSAQEMMYVGGIQSAGVFEIVNRTPQQVKQQIKKYYSDADINREKETVKNAVRSEISPVKGPMYRLAQIIIILLSVLYTAINFVRVTKGEGQSKDALIKVFLGLLFGMIALGVLEAFFGTGTLLSNF